MRNKNEDYSEHKLNELIKTQLVIDILTVLDHVRAI